MSEERGREGGRERGSACCCIACSVWGFIGTKPELRDSSAVEEVDRDEVGEL